jgi:hypothetical protein
LSDPAISHTRNLTQIAVDLSRDCVGYHELGVIEGVEQFEPKL